MRLSTLLEEDRVSFQNENQAKSGTAEVAQTGSGSSSPIDALLETLSAVLQKPDDPKARAAAGNAFVALECWRNASEEFEQWIALDASNASAHVALGFTYYRAGKVQEALGEYRRASELDPQNAKISDDVNQLSKMPQKGQARHEAADGCGSLQEWQSVAQSWKPESLAPGGRIRVGGQVMAARVLRGPSPVYPETEKMAGVQGVVRLAAIIGENGYIHGLRLISGPPPLVRPAMVAVARWQYRPTLLNGNPVQVMTEIDVTFQLR